ncbi:hypothetical protein C2E20_4771 [Micractinium conductrix]|uniref:Uncharacterized protein n=1 Tax=Micractinium conductrix TaxID=554055 RepID=A0A2P6VD45_9CHLO|nr:hypothetical protein C2E20_4771 [Micractinium conductrix]|eukprot:PSC72016.1 hypothetical protein C2E20_4771 [Micractinium conductrix]
MHEELESLLDNCATVPSHTAIAYLTAFQRADAETRRCQYRSLLRRFTQGKADQVAACLSHWLGAGGAAAAAGVAGGGGAAGNVADVGTSDGADAGAVAAAGSVPSGRSHQERLQANWATQT